MSFLGDAAAQQNDADTEEISFTHTFTAQTTLIGAAKATLWMSCPEHHDFDVFVQIRKADASGKMLLNVNIPLEELGVSSEDEVDNTNVLKYVGPTGILRASHRTLDPVLSKPHWPAHDHTKEDLVEPGSIVKLEIGIWASAMQFDAGEKLVFKVSGHQMTLAEFESLRGGFLTGNKGKQIVHFGPEFDSRLEIPIVQI